MPLDKPNVTAYTHLLVTCQHIEGTQQVDGKQTSAPFPRRGKVYIKSGERGFTAVGLK